LPSDYPTFLCDESHCRGHVQGKERGIGKDGDVDCQSQVVCHLETGFDGRAVIYFHDFQFDIFSHEGEASRPEPLHPLLAPSADDHFLAGSPLVPASARLSQGPLPQRLLQLRPRLPRVVHQGIPPLPRVPRSHRRRQTAKRRVQEQERRRRRRRRRRQRRQG
jgi:hypothetical protein